MNAETGHLSLSKLRQYCDDELPDFERCAIEDHFADCEECFGVFRRMDALFGDGFTAAAYEAAIVSARRASDSLVIALRGAAARFGDYADTLKTWLDSAPSFWGAGQVPAFGAAAAAIKGEQPGPLTVQLPSDVARARVYVAESGNDIHVAVEGRAPRLALLFDAESDSSPLVARFEPRETGATARFENLPEGEYFVAVSPF